MDLYTANAIQNAIEIAKIQQERNEAVELLRRIYDNVKLNKNKGLGINPLFSLKQFIEKLDKENE